MKLNALSLRITTLVRKNSRRSIGALLVYHRGVLKYMTVSAAAADPVKLWLDKMSDHAALQVSLLPVSLVEPGAGTKPQRISPQLAKSDKFKVALEKLLGAAQLCSLPTSASTSATS